MQGQGSFDGAPDLLHDWIDAETRPLDVVASWESLCDAYRALEFSDPISDTVRLEEFKWIIKEMNKFLTRMRTKLMPCREIDDAIQALLESFTPTGKVTIEGRRSLAYQKLRQRWITQAINQLSQMNQEMMEAMMAMQEGEAHGWS